MLIVISSQHMHWMKPTKIYSFILNIMKKPIYPLWLKISVMLICVMYISIVAQVAGRYTYADLHAVWVAWTLAAAYAAFALLMLSALFILREKEALYSVVLISFMTLFAEFIIGYYFGLLAWVATLVYIIPLLLHIAILVKLSYMCYGAIAWWGNYKKK